MMIFIFLLEFIWARQDVDVRDVVIEMWKVR